MKQSYYQKFLMDAYSQAPLSLTLKLDKIDEIRFLEVLSKKSDQPHNDLMILNLRYERGARYDYIDQVLGTPKCTSSRRIADLKSIFRNPYTYLLLTGDRETMKILQAAMNSRYGLLTQLAVEEEA